MNNVFGKSIHNVSLAVHRCFSLIKISGLAVELLRFSHLNLQNCSYCTNVFVKMGSICAKEMKRVIKMSLSVQLI